ncbi:hypothetical protein HanRHA438_Chr01g0001821 [Helianthus annuus]|nr:hypothetical protein HanLR1_Chr00c2973g0863191 [Helianthus annuus]KAJ0946239.1 hypothetical protein HanRHA438_Chr01g0001821 [Helianthus annuus]
MLSCIGETKRGHVLSRTVSFFGSPSRRLMFQLKFHGFRISQSGSDDESSKTKPRGDRVVYTCRVAVESAKWVKLVMDQFTLLMETQFLKVILYMDGVKEVHFVASC